jgi:phasin family protein
MGLPMPSRFPLPWRMKPVPILRRMEVWRFTPPQKAKEIMGKIEKAKNGFFDVTTAFGNFRVPGMDVDAVVAAQRKNFEALTRANQFAVEGLRAVAKRQAEIGRQTIEEASALLHDWTQPGAAEERLANTVEAAKRAFEKGVTNVRELNDLTTKASANVFGVIARRVSEGLDEVRLYVKKQAAAE